MSLDRFSAFSFVDRITSTNNYGEINGSFKIPDHLDFFPHSLVAEAIGQRVYGQKDGAAQAFAIVRAVPTAQQLLVADGTGESSGREVSARLAGPRVERRAACALQRVA
jgi:hypothetical protein